MGAPNEDEDDEERVKRIQQKRLERFKLLQALKEEEERLKEEANKGKVIALEDSDEDVTENERLRKIEEGDAEENAKEDKAKEVGEAKDAPQAELTKEEKIARRKAR